ncbi:phosphoribosylanthranilate isomerase [Tautonia sp. JC769]|uniref:phosphoribosylanthranilate isomerase n=1 Tax=Tautonia sp. JC769 TaxID=3232135 RepID=UPI003457A220
MSLSLDVDINASTPLIKICGVTTADDARMVAGSGADWIGLNFHPGSKRYVAPDRAPVLVAAMAGLAEPVGLFVDRLPVEIVRESERAGVRIVQLHGDEPAETVRDLKRDGYQVIRAFRLADRASLDRLEAWLVQAAEIDGSPDAVLIDAFVPGQQGGTGHPIATEVLDHLAARLNTSRFLSTHHEADGHVPRLILAGGLTPENVAEAVDRVRPWMVDVASGVESSPGRKDRDRVLRFIRAVRSA